ncbi:sporulation histidine kinase inhibitor Sda [Salinibacillus xinjiangensis]|uniref:Sporulation histidine kinase inhibitor Sda n=1 Tax=Salinibacillus xinjiangensis TaxID=1229268 RepID=A0A6G1X1V3_9BACI|nr:sporulation histidine kinase inhibitor Sda [Salinibacillus xinjiangensis]
MGFRNLSDELLIQSFQKAKELELDEEFIKLLKEEIDFRGISKQSIINVIDSTIMTNHHLHNKVLSRLTEKPLNKKTNEIP